MTLITVWLDCLDEQFVFYNIIHVVQKYPSNTLDPSVSLIQRASPFILMSEERSCDSVHYLFKNYSEIPYCSRDTMQVLGAEPLTPIWGHTSTKWKVHIVYKFILNNFCSTMFLKIFFAFEKLHVKDTRFWPLNSLFT